MISGMFAFVEGEQFIFLLTINPFSTPVDVPSVAGPSSYYCDICSSYAQEMQIQAFCG